MSTKPIYKQFEKICALHNISGYKLNKETGVSASTFTNWKKGTSFPKPEKLQKIADYFNVSISYFYVSDDDTKHPDPRKNKNTGIKIPVLGYVVAGIPIDAVQEILDYEEITQELANTGDFFGLSIKGSSMEPRICEGDVVIVRKQSCIDSGDTAVVLVNGDEATVKKVKIQSNGITLIANNNNVYEPHFYSNREIKSLPIQIIGKVVELRGKNKF